MSNYLRIFLRFCFIIVLQMLVLNKVTLRWWLEPMGFPIFIPLVYPLFILLLPFETPVWGMIFIGFFTGLTVDSFYNTAGMHAAATLFIAYLRTNVLNALLPKNLTEYARQDPSVKNMGWTPFLTYSAFLLLLHMMVFYSFELWNFVNIGYLMLKILTSTVTSMLFVIIYILLFTRQSISR